LPITDPAILETQARAGTGPDWDATYLAHARGERKDLIPFPDEATQRLTNSAWGEDTARDALQIRNSVFALAEQKLTLDPSLRVLDYGCGWGRLTRLLLREIDCRNICGVDVDARLVESANALLPVIDHRLIHSMQPLPLEDRRFDLAFANSVFSHLSRASHEHTIAELARVLKPGGVAVLSLLDVTATERLYAAEDTRAWVENILGSRELLRQRLETDGFHWGDTGRWHEYGLAVVDNAWVEETWPHHGLVPFACARGDHQRAQLFVAAEKPA